MGVQPCTGPVRMLIATKPIVCMMPAGLCFEVHTSQHCLATWPQLNAKMFIIRSRHANHSSSDYTATPPSASACSTDARNPPAGMTNNGQGERRRTRSL